MNYSKFFEGERHFVVEMENFILNVIRMYGFRYGKPIGFDLDKKLKELNLVKLHEHGKKILFPNRKLILDNTIKPQKNEIRFNEDLDEEIFKLIKNKNMKHIKSKAGRVLTTNENTSDND